MDGWGYAPPSPGNAIAAAHTPVYDKLLAEFPWTTLPAHGEAVGLPAGQMGGSEVGHLCLGAGRIVYQDLTYLNKLVEEGEFQRNQVLLEAMNRVVASSKALHLMGLVSPGGVHSHQDHIYTLVEMAKKAGVGQVFIHAFLDGRDVPPASALPFIDELEARLSEIGLGRIATVSGRYYAMDRDNRWDRTKRAWDAMVHGVGATATSARAGIEASYAAGVTDEFVLPIVIVDDDGAPLATVSDGDSLIFFNFRGDRARQLTQAFNIEEFDKFDRGRRPRVHYVCMMKYLDADIPVAFSMPEPHHGLAETLALHGRTQLHAAETEKFAHVTFFFNGGRERPFTGEYRVLVPSPKVATYDLMPEMSAAGVAEEAVKCILSGHFDFAVINFANCDMVGHTGVFDAAVKAVEAVDRCVGQVWDAVRSVGGALLVTADHGNADAMVDHDTGGPSTAHSLNPVPFILAGTEARRLRDGGNFGDVAPTILELMGIQQPAAMTGASLIAG
ncbi:MAG: 2,3-bisphosphoglycerate-independent phosphoglycerate mutase [Bacillota bacterium]|jgi:2,3-bisphosphoglycerate-independent phosphoglycerate mutase